ncbi:hypothetical protein EV127DRAFT_250077 [Xylaria flabelliformis]|nr:hypothetical protein EV127DRAFT_250077 [Xylaria flabelliformis]
MLKALPAASFRDRDFVSKVIGLIDELLYYAHKVEKRSKLDETPLVLLSDQLDEVNSHHPRDVSNRGLGEYYEVGKCNFLALMVRARLVKYVRAKLQADQRNIQKRGRPLLDYALRQRIITPNSMPYHSVRASTLTRSDYCLSMAQTQISPCI